MAYIYDDLRPKIKAVYKTMSTDIDVEGQQRAVEYTKLSAMKTKRSEVVEVVLDSMPPFPERGNALENLLKKKSEKSKDAERGGDEDEDDSDEDDSDDSDDDDDDNDDDDDDDNNNDDDDEDGEDSSSGSDDDNATASSGGVGDLLDLMSDTTVASSSNSTQSNGDSEGIPQDLMPKVLECFRKGCVRGKQLLYMDGMIQVGIQQQYSGHQGKLMLFFTNKSSSNITNLSVLIEKTNFLKWNVDVANLMSNETLSGNGGNSKKMVQLMVMKPFVSPPELRLQYVGPNGAKYKYALRLPIVCTRFVAPANGMQPQKFTGLWSSIPDSKQAQGVCDAGCKISDCMSQIRALVKGGMRMALVDGVTTNQYVVAAAGSFKTGSKDANGKQLMVGCLLRLECNPKNNKYRVTVRAHHIDVAKAIQTIVVNQLSGVNLTAGGPNSGDSNYDGGPTGM